MQDRFKVRVWNTLVKKFSYFDKPEMQIGTDGFDNGLIFPLSENSNLYMGKYSEPQFCTGLKDKNGKLIYEGDIVQTTFKNNSKIIFSVVYDDETALFNGKIIKKEGINNYFMPNRDYLYYLLGDKEDEVEVIGNIYENPELLEEN